MILYIIVFVDLFIEIIVYVCCCFLFVGNGVYYQVGFVCCIVGYEYVFGELGMFGFQEFYCQKNQVGFNYFYFFGGFYDRVVVVGIWSLFYWFYFYIVYFIVFV